MSRVTTLLLAVASLGVAGSAIGAGRPTTAQSDFAYYAVRSGMAEIEDAKTAQQKATSDAVKQFAGQMIKDHGPANDELTALAKSKGVVLPQKMSMVQQSANARLKAASPSSFDQAYLDQEISDHQAAIGTFQKEADSGTDPELKSFAQKTLPVLQHHLDMAKSLKKS